MSRPLTAIREGDNDGNRRTHGDSTWTPYCATPPVADYPSTHALLGGAASAVLARALGDRTAFTADSSSLPGDQGRKLGDYVFAHALKPKRGR